MVEIRLGSKMKELKNIVLINDFDYVNGGTAQIAITTANALSAMGYNIIFLSAVTEPKKDLVPGVLKINTGQYEILKDPNKLRAASQGVWNNTAAIALTKLLYSLDPRETIVHIHGWVKALSSSIGKVLSVSRFPAVLTLHDYFIACPNGGFFNYRTNSICQLKPMSIQCVCTNCDSRNFTHKSWRVLRQYVQNRAGHIPDGINNFISVTSFSEEILRPYLPKHAHIYRVTNPVNNPFAYPKRVNPSSGRLIYIGRLSPEKGITLACEAARRSKSRMIVIGDGDLKKDLQEKYPEIEFKGWLPSSHVFEEMLTASALVFPSVLYETQGLAVSEAFSVGLPVIVSDKSAASELVNFENGILFRSGDVSDLSAKMELMLADPKALERRSINIFKTYWENPNTVKKYADQLLQVYENIINNN